MKANVDRSTCIGCGLCSAICPEVFKMDNEGLAVAEDIELTGTELEGARDTSEQCPVGAIKVD